MKSSTLQIAIPEGVTFSLPLAGPVTRAVAYFIDVMAIAALFNIIAPILRLMSVTTGDWGAGAVLLIQFVILEGARMVCELLWRGQTLGKKVLGLRVIDERGLKLRPSQVIVRNLLRAVDALPFFYAVGGTVALFSQRSQRLGDLAAGTVVIRRVPIYPPDASSLEAGKYNSFRDHPQLEMRLRQKTSPEEAQIALQLLNRREELDPEPRVKLFALLAERFREKVTFPEESVHGLSDEQYVRNAAETLYRKR